MRVLTLHPRAVDAGKRRARGAAVFVATSAIILTTGLPAQAASSPAPKNTPSGQSTSKTTATSKTTTAAATATSNATAKTTTKQSTGASSGSDAQSAAEASAAAQAKKTGHPVVVAAETTDILQVSANPDGTFTFVSNAEPVRVKVGGNWTPISTTLKKNADGTWSPAASVGAPRFSAGGTGPLVVETDPTTGKAVRVGWPGTLPAPSVSGSSATYPNVYPGVDLRLEATNTGYSEVYIVHDKAAAADPALTSVLNSGQTLVWDSTEPTRPSMQKPGPDAVGSGLHAEVLASKDRASLPAVAGAHPVFPLYLSPQPQPQPGPQTPAQAQAAMRSFATSAALATPQVEDQYSGPGWTEADEFQINDSYKTWSGGSGDDSTSLGNGAMQLGVCDILSGDNPCRWAVYSDDSNQYLTEYWADDFFSFDTSPLLNRSDGAKATVYSAYFNDQVLGWGGSSDCTSTDQINLYGTTGTAGSGTDYPGPLGSALGHASSACPGKSVGSGSGLDALGSGGVCANCGEVSLGLQPNDTSGDDNSNFWTISNAATLAVTFDFPPNTPGSLSVSDEVQCSSATGSTAVYTRDANPTLYATATDNNPTALPLYYFFQVVNPSDTSDKYSWNTGSGTGPFDSGSQGNWTTDAGSGGLPENDEFDVEAANQGEPSNGEMDSAWSGYFPFQVLGTAPSAAPTIQSFDYPANQWGQPLGDSGVFTVGTGGDSNIAGFAYSFDGGTDSETIPTDGINTTAACGYTDNGGLGSSIDSSTYNTSTPEFGSTTGALELLPGGDTAQIHIPKSLAVGIHTLRVRSFDYAHAPSPEETYTFYVAPNYNTADQPISIVNGDTLSAGSSGVPGVSDVDGIEMGTQTGNCCGVTWHDGSQIYGSDGPNSTNTFTVSFKAPGPTGYVGNWSLGTNMTTSSNYGEFRVDLNHATSGTDYGLGGTDAVPFDGYSPKVSLKWLDLGTVQLTGGSVYSLTFTCVGKDASSAAYDAGIDFLDISPTNLLDAYSSAVTPTASAGTVGPQASANQDYPGDRQLFWSNTTDGATLSLSFDAPVESDYAVGAILTRSGDYGNLQFDMLGGSGGPINLDNTANTPWVGNNPSVISGYKYLGPVHLTAGQYTLRITVAGTSSTIDNLYNAGIAELQVAPVTSAIEDSFTDAMNNHGISDDNTTDSAYPPNFDGTGNTLSNESFTAASDPIGTAFSPTPGTSVTMPGGNSDHMDNVIADGQTIKLPTLVGPVTGISLLLASTCGASSPGVATIGYSNGPSEQQVIPSVPDWVTGSKAGAALTLGYINETSGDVPSTADKPSLFVATLLTDSSYVPDSITLPQESSSLFTTGSCAQSLHVLGWGYDTVAQAPSGTWVGAYAAPADTTGALPAPTGTTTGETVSEIVTPSHSYGGPVRLHLSNSSLNGTISSAIVFDSVTIAVQGANGGNTTGGRPLPVTFGGLDTVTVAGGSGTYSDPVQLPAGYANGDSLVVSMHIPQSAVSAGITAPLHTNASATTYFSAGDTTQNTVETASSQTAAGDYYLDEVDVDDPTAGDGTIAILGDDYALDAPGTSTGGWGVNLANDVLANPGSGIQVGTNGTALPGAVANYSVAGMTIAQAGSYFTNYVSTTAPGLRDVVLAVGANDLENLPASTTVAAELPVLEGDINALVNQLEGKARVELTTIPPQGWPTTDVKEQLREDINSWIYNSANTTAYYYADTAGALAQSGSINDVNPAYLTNGTPNAGYYTELASTITYGFAAASTTTGSPQPLIAPRGLPPVF